MVGVRLAVVKSDFDALSTDDQKQLGGIFIMSASLVMGLLTGWLRHQSFREPVAYAFELGDRGSGLFAKAAQSIVEDSPVMAEHVLSVNLENKRRFPGLQAADILAFEVCRDLPRFLRDRQRVSRYPYTRLMKAIPHVGYYMNARSLQLLLREHTPQGYAESRAEFRLRPHRARQKKRRRSP